MNLQLKHKEVEIGESAKELSIRRKKKKEASSPNLKMAFSCFEFLIVLIISFLSVQAQGNYHPYGGRMLLFFASILLCKKLRKLSLKRPAKQ